VATLKENTDLEKWGGSTAARLAPTEIGTWVNDFLVENFKHVVDFGFTADMEERFDEIAIGKRNWQEELEKFYKNFHPEVTLAENIERKAVSKMRLIGVDPKDNEEIYARFGKYGPMLQKGRGDNKEDKVTFAAMPDGEKVESVSLEKALKMFELPRILGKNGDDEIRVNIGMFGPYIQIGKKFVSINKDELWNIDENEAIKRYKEKFLHTIIGPKIGRKKLPESIEIIKGPYGSYLQYLKQKAKLAEDIDYLNLSFDQAKEIIETEAKKPKKSFRRRAPKRK
jgi:DNA topoisomerase-1